MGRLLRGSLFFLLRVFIFERREIGMEKQILNRLLEKYSLIKDMSYQNLLQLFIFSILILNCYLLLNNEVVLFYSEIGNIFGLGMVMLTFYAYYKYVKKLQEHAKNAVIKLFEKKEKKKQTIDCGCGYVFTSYQRNNVWVFTIKHHNKIFRKEELD